MQKSKKSKAKKSSLNLEKDFRELKDTEIKIRKETEPLPRPKIEIKTLHIYQDPGS